MNGLSVSGAFSRRRPHVAAVVAACRLADRVCMRSPWWRSPRHGATRARTDRPRNLTGLQDAPWPLFPFFMWPIYLNCPEIEGRLVPDCSFNPDLIVHVAFFAYTVNY